MLTGILDFLKGLFKKREIVDLSFSRIKAYNSCPLKYKLIYEMQWKEKLNAPMSLGLSLHRALEEFHKTRSITLEALLGYLDEFWVNNGFQDAQDSYDNYEQARDMLTKYFEQWQTEKGEIIDVEKKFLFDFGSFRLQGIIDRVDRMPDGEYEVIDYKTRVKPNEQLSGDSSIQLGIYYLACEKIYGTAPKLLSYYCLRSGERFTLKFDDTDKAKLTGQIKAVAECIKQKKFSPNTAHCAKCNFDKRCPKK